MFEIRCDGQAFNPCRGMSESEARAAFDMYTGPQAAKGHTFTLFASGRKLDERHVEKGKR